jgi:glycosyltransferase involved in cell wall biosynthesis
VAYHRNPDAAVDLLPDNATPRFIEMAGDRFDAWERWRLPAAVWNDGTDLLHCPANTSPSWRAKPLVVTVHDTIPLDRPRDYTHAHCRQFERHMRRAVRGAAAIVCPSRYTAQRLVDLFHADRDRLHVIPQAASTDMRPADRAAIDATRLAYNLTRPYVLHLGAAAPRKNTARVIDSWARLSPMQRADHTLLIVGLDTVVRAKYQRQVTTLRADDTIDLYGYVPQTHLPALMSGATCLVYPSLAEGFGLPVLDGFATDTPVLTSNLASLPEVAGDAALLVDPHDTDAIAAGLTEILTSQTLRQQLVAAGRQRRQAFNWSNAADALAVCFESVAQSSAYRPRRRAA